MPPARKVALRVNGVQFANASVLRSQKGPELIVADLVLGEFAVTDQCTLELLEHLHAPEMRLRLPNRGWRKASLRILIALLGSGVIRVVEES